MKIFNQWFRSLYFRFALSYVIILLIPIIILNITYSKHMSQTIKNEILSSVKSDQRYASTLLDDKISNMYKTSNQFQLTQGYKDYLLTNDFYSSSNNLSYGEIIEDVFALHRINELTENYYIYFYNKKCVFSSNGIHEIDYFLSHEFIYDDFTPNTFKKYLHSIHSPVVLKSQEATINGTTDTYVTFLFPLFSAQSNTIGTAIYCIKDKQLTQLFSERLHEYNTSTYILNKNNEIICVENPFDTATSYFMSLTKDHIMEKTINLNNTKYDLIENISSENGWKYITLLNQNQNVFQIMESTTTNFIFYIAITLLISLIAIYYMMRLNYAPIRKLKEKASNFAKFNFRKTDVETISTALDFLHEENYTLQSKFKSHAALIRNNQLRKLVNGFYANIEEFNIDCEQIEMSFSYNNFFIAIILLQNLCDNIEDISANIKTLLEQHFENRYLVSLEPQKFIIINCIKEINFKVIVDTYCGILKRINKETGITATVGIGNCFNGTLEISKSYIEAQSSLDYRFIKGTGTVILFSEIKNVQSISYPYPINYFEKLKNSVTSNNISGITNAIDSILEYITINKVPLFLAKGLCFDIIKIISEAELYSKIISKKPEINWYEFSDVETAQEIISIIKDFSENLIIDKQNSISSNKNILEEIIGFININCLRCDFSIQEVSEKFSILPSNLSTFFKGKTGIGILEYMIDVRMDKAKELLKSTDLPLKEISYSIGYYNTSSFIRRFKEHQGITPGNYRASFLES